ncbi:MAG TPA: GTPase ObgE [Chitinophagales bacterium]|nr:GTPase ObgE [Chitinophagales bacterium]
MASENFIDYVKIHCKSGKGGAGASSFRREKFIAKGGPDGGDGGRGGHIILRGNAQLWTLLHLKYQKHVMAKDGARGMGALCTGKTGEDRILEVPLGTIARDFETGEQLAEISEDGEEFILVEGGKGGRGNNHFKTATNQAPTYAQPGLPSIESWIILELKLLADVGLVGFPNAGKSTLIAAVSNAKPEIADYPFTTLVPNLGIVSYKGGKSFVMADIPGIIEGASEGKGLGLRFLRHIERNSILLFMVPVDSNNILHDYKVLLTELEKYNPELLTKDRILAITKCDTIDEELRKMIEKELKAGIAAPKSGFKGTKPLFISAATGYGIDKLKDEIMKKLTA